MIRYKLADTHTMISKKDSDEFLWNLQQVLTIMANYLESMHAFIHDASCSPPRLISRKFVLKYRYNYTTIHLKTKSVYKFSV